MNLYKALITISSITILSRFTGLIREILFAREFGASSYTDAFNIAFRIPNLLRRLFAEGAFSQALIPILTEYKTQKHNTIIKDLINNIVTVLIWMMFIVSAIGIAIAPAIIYCVAAGLKQNQDIFHTTVFMTRVMFPYVGFMAFVALSGSILNTWSKFAIPAMTSIFLNISLIFTLLFVSKKLTQPIYGLAFSVLLGGILQACIQIPALIKINMLPKLYWNPIKSLHHKDVKRLFKKIGSAIFAVSAIQISLIINTNIASHLPHGSISWLSYADRVMEFPIALLGVTLGAVLLPRLSKAYSQDSIYEYSALLNWGLRLTFFFALPCVICLIILAKPLITTLFHYGKFSTLDVIMSSQALAAYSIGLVGLILVKILASGFYATQDILTPMKITVIVLIATQFMNYIFVPYISHVGLSLSIGLSACLNAFLLFYKLQRLNIYKSELNWKLFFIKLIPALLMLTIVAIFMAHHFDWIVLSTQPFKRINALIIALATCAFVYFAVLFLIGFRFHDLTYAKIKK